MSAHFIENLRSQRAPEVVFSRFAAEGCRGAKKPFDLFYADVFRKCRVFSVLLCVLIPLRICVQISFWRSFFDVLMRRGADVEIHFRPVLWPRVYESVVFCRGFRVRSFQCKFAFKSRPGGLF